MELSAKLESLPKPEAPTLHLVFANVDESRRRHCIAREIIDHGEIFMSMRSTNAAIVPVAMQLAGCA